MRQEGGEHARAHPTKGVRWRRGAKGVEIRRPGERAPTLVGAGAGWAGGLAAPAHGLGAGRNAGGDFAASGLFTGLVVGSFVMEKGFLALFRLALWGLAGLGSGGVFVVPVKGPDGACGSGNRTESAESEREANNQKEFLH